MEKGRPLPEWYLTLPELDSISAFYISSFWDLNTCRADGPIPWTAIREYASWLDLDNRNTSFFIRAIMEMDKIFNEWKKD